MLAKKKIKNSRANNLRSLKKRKKRRKAYVHERGRYKGGTLFDVSRRCEAAKRAFIISTVFEPKLSSTTLES